MKQRQSATITFHGIEWRVGGVYLQGRPAKFYLANGDPGYPAEPSELDDVTIVIATKHGVSDEFSDILTDEAKEKLVEIALELMDDPLYAEIPF